MHSIVKALVSTIKVAACATLLTCTTLLSSTLSYANSTAQLNTVKSQITNLKKTIQQDKQAIKQLEKVIWGLDAKVLNAQKTIRKERNQQRAAYHDIKRNVKQQEFDIERLNNAIALVDNDIEQVQRDSQRSHDYYQSLNTIKQKFEEADHFKKLKANQQQVEILLSKKQQLVETKDEAMNKLALLQQQLTLAKSTIEDSNLEDDPRFTSLLKQRNASGKKIQKMRSQLAKEKKRLSYLAKKVAQLNNAITTASTGKEKSATAAISTQQKTPTIHNKTATAQQGKRPTYVFVISGDQQTNIEDALQLKEWVESYGAQYIQARWNGFTDNEATDSSQFIADFSNQLSQLESKARIILIGHGRGGGSAIRAATEVAFNAGRTIEFLAVLDPIGDKNLRANIVYNTTINCTQPKKGDELTNSEYITCLKESKKRLITNNVKHFYNRWQKDSQGPADFYRRIKAIDENGQNIESPTATGRFVTAQSTLADQKRVFFGDQTEAHKALLAEEARNLPKLLVKHLR
ncbi:MAG: hypothetical protein CSA49_06215 [Gammaproteobacteria bacterium]|nr:MAG: hypothetical protein CSA49_06215 [Gammaproteobacteria bacterium]